MSTFLKGFQFVALATCGVIVSAAEKELPKFESLGALIRSNLTGVTEAEIDRAATQGLLAHFKGRVVLAGANTAPKPGAPAIAKQETFDSAFSYLRIARVEGGVAEKVTAALEKVRTNKKMKGLVLDLRFANGLDYAEAVKVADFFLAEERPVLDWGTGSGKSTAKENAFKLPTMVLVNAQTRGAPEALAAVLRETRVALVIGGKTGGEANLFREFTIDGQRVRIASGKVKLAGGGEMPATGLAPDIAVSIGLDEEKAFLADPFKAGTTDFTPASATGTNVQRRRINEAELVRMQKEGRSLDDKSGATNSSPAAKAETAKLIVRDPALARALDLLKGLAIVKPGR